MKWEQWLIGCFGFKACASYSAMRGFLEAGLLPGVVTHVADNAVSLEGHIITYFKIKSQLGEHSSLWERFQSECQACNSILLQSRAPERRINGREAQAGLSVSFPISLFLTGETWLLVIVSKMLGSAMPSHSYPLASAQAQVMVPILSSIGKGQG